MSVQNISAKDFQSKVLEAKVYTLVDFWAPWCVPCQMMAPILEELAADSDLGSKLQIYKVNTEESENQSLAMQLQIMSIPNLKLFYEGKMVKDFIGYRGTSQFKQELLSVINQ
jgi:thioredoxin 1